MTNGDRRHRSRANRRSSLVAPAISQLSNPAKQPIIVCLLRAGIQTLTGAIGMANDKKFDVDKLQAIDVHVHIEHEGEETGADEAARKYFGEGAPRGRAGMAEYYRSRNIGCVVFTVAERLSGRPQVSNDTVIEFAAQNSDIMMAFASVDPLYKVIEEAQLPVLFHTGHSGIGTGMPGGGGIRLKYGNPMYIDDVAVDFPD